MHPTILAFQLKSPVHLSLSSAGRQPKTAIPINVTTHKQMVFIGSVSFLATAERVALAAFLAALT